jgi:hypothetical protein
MRLLLPLLLVAALPACSLVLGDGHKAELEAPVDFAADGADGIRIEGVNGRIVLEAGPDGAVTGTTKYYAKAATAEAAAARVGEMGWETELEGSTLIVTLRRPSDDRREYGASLTLAVPASWQVDADTSNGSVQVDGQFQKVLIATSNGRIDVHSDGVVRARTSNGRIEYRGGSQDFDLRTSNGRVTALLEGDFAGSGRVRTSNGSVDVECTGNLAASVSTSTSNGSLRVRGPEPVGEGELRIETSNGSVEVNHVGPTEAAAPAESPAPTTR